MARAALLVAVGLAACAGPAAPGSPESPEPARLERPARVERVRFHGAADAAAAERARAMLAERLAADGARHAPSLALDLQLARVEVRRRPRAAGLVTAWLGDGAWRVDGRLFGRLRVRDAAGCLVAEVQTRRDYQGRAGLREPPPLPGEEDLRALVDRLVALAGRRLDRATASARRSAPCRAHASRGILAASDPP